MRTLFGLCAALAAVGSVAADDKTKDDKSKLDGTYTIVSGEHGGKALPKEHFEGGIVKFTDKAIMGTDKDKKEFFAATYTVDTSKTPWEVTMTSKGKEKDAKEEKTTGLMKADGETVTIIYALPGGKTPTEFKTGENQNLFVLKRVADKKEK